jgi:hypothetical protein
LLQGANGSLATPIVDETNYEGQLDIDLTSKLQLNPDNIQAVKDNLNKYGLDIISEDKNIDMLIIKDASKN